MHLRISRVTRNGKTYASAQLVESYRRPSDGMPAHRIVAHLGQLTPTQIDNLKTALAASRRGEAVAVAVATEPSPRSLRRPVANLRYLDLAVLLELWREWGLDELLAQLFPRGETDVAPAVVVLALVLQRCVDPGSKLYAERWFPRTALPELLGVAPESFNNTRVHRVLDELDAVTPALMARLPTLYLEHARSPSFAALYLDVTDAAFVGHGPDLAARGKTKEGVIRRKIGIVLLCNDQGYPLRWQVIAGNTADSSAMLGVFQTVAKTRWAQRTPIVCDRAMGTTAQLRSLAATGLHFVTALVTTEFGTYAAKLPSEKFSTLRAPVEVDVPARAAAIEQARLRAEAAGLERVSDTLWVTDLGVVEIGGDPEPLADCAPAHPTTTVAHALELARTIEQAVVDGRFPSFVAAGRAHGITKPMTAKYRLLCRLPPDVQEAILNGEADRLSLEQLLGVVKLPDASAQRARFAELCERAATRRPKRAAARPMSPNPEPNKSFRVRVVGYFNPERFVEQRVNTERQMAQVAAFASELNERLASPGSRLKRDDIVAAVDRRLRRDDLLDAYKLSIVEHSSGARPSYRIQLDPIAAAWDRRRRCHGFSVLVAHPDLTHSAADLSKLYRAKDRVEKDFQTIKSLVQLRPIRHRNDAKVSAHVTLCMLALLLERRLTEKLDRAASATLELLATCQLNQYRGPRETSASLYTVTEPDPEQLAILRQLRLQLLADEGDVAARLAPRSYLQAPAKCPNLHASA